MGLAQTNDGFLVCSYLDALYKFAKNGSMDELATAPVLADYGRGFRRCAVHQQTQRTYAIAESEAGSRALVLLDANLQLVATVEATGVAPELPRSEEDYEPIRDVTVHGDQVIVLASNRHANGSGLRLLDLDGQFVRTIAAGQLTDPYAVTASQGRAFVVDYDQKKRSNMLHVIDIKSGDFLQTVRLKLRNVASAMIVDGDEIYIAKDLYRQGGSATDPGEVIVLQFAGSAAAAAAVAAAEAQRTAMRTAAHISRIETLMHDWTQLLNHVNEAVLKETWQLPSEEIFQRILVMYGQMNDGRSKRDILRDKYNQCKDPACPLKTRSAFIRALKRIAESFMAVAAAQLLSMSTTQRI